jgi:hypothetical protein
MHTSATTALMSAEQIPCFKEKIKKETEMMKAELLYIV